MLPKPSSILNPVPTPTIHTPIQVPPIRHFALVRSQDAYSTHLLVAAPHFTSAFPHLGAGQLQTPGSQAYSTSTRFPGCPPAWSSGCLNEKILPPSIFSEHSSKKYYQPSFFGHNSKHSTREKYCFNTRPSELCVFCNFRNGGKKRVSCFWASGGRAEGVVAPAQATLEKCVWMRGRGPDFRPLHRFGCWRFDRNPFPC